ncbi:hypothetical protein [Mycobacterium sp. pW045]|uniref:hypothetical protein n=1 Tax=Mycobacterium sp. pW045 TaxID=3238984 RepID=UPI00351B7844
MSETPDTTTTPPAPPGEPKPYWLYRLAAWVAIVAGIVFIVSSIFFAGVWASKGGPRGHHCHHKHHGAMFHKGFHEGFHGGFHHGPHRGPGSMAPPSGPEGPGPGEVPPLVTRPPAPTPGR